MLSSIGNYYEQLVEERIRALLAEGAEPIGPALDQGFIDDVACLALNNLPPRYVRHSVDLVARITDTERAAMHEAVAKAVGFAMETVKRRTTSRADDQGG